MIHSQHHYNRYTRFIGSLRGQPVHGYAEVHHIVPRSLGGSDDADNLVRLTARQHYVAHWMLARALGGSAARAFFMMSNFGKYGQVNSTTYAMARQEYAEQISQQLKDRPNVPVFTDAHRLKLRQAKLGRKLPEETRRKVGEAQRGRKLSEETRKRISDAKKGIATRGCGWKHSDETRKKMTESQLARSQQYLKWLEEGNTPQPADTPEE
jgi:hypothetical protein